MNNFEKIKNMTLDEMATLLSYAECTICTYNEEKFCYDKGLKCTDGIKQWLQQET